MSSIPYMVKASTTIVVLLFCVSCSYTQKERVFLKHNYDRLAQYHEPDRNPIIVIPGILGSKLVDDKTGQTVWGAFRAEYADPNTEEGAQLIALPMSMDDTEGIDDVRPDGVLEALELDLFGFPVSIRAYANLLATLGAGGYRDESLGLSQIDYGTDHFTCFQFDYDWRRDISHNASKLAEFIELKKAEVSKKYDEHYGISDADIKFDLVAHSMGSLVTRYYLRFGDQALPEDGSIPSVTWQGAKNVERAILVAPPNAGSLNAFDKLLNGFDVGAPLLPTYHPVILGTFPSLYQSLPRDRHRPLINASKREERIDLINPETWQKYEWGLSATDAKSLKMLNKLMPELSQDQRRFLAKEFQSHVLERANQFHQAMDQVSTPPNSLEMFLVAGDGTEVTQSLVLNENTGEIEALRLGTGDKTVLRSSALLDERIGGEWTPTLNSPIHWSSVLFLPLEHRELTNNAIFDNNVLFWLLDSPREHLRNQASKE